MFYLRLTEKKLERPLKFILEDKLEKVNRKELAQECFNFISTRAYLDLNGWSEIDIFRH